MSGPGEYIAPEEDKSEYHCPHCGVYASQEWKDLKFYHADIGEHVVFGRKTRCEHCDEHQLWIDEKLVYPASATAPEPAEEMPENVKNDFEEARLVVDDSPKAAAALLRRAIEGLIDELLDDPEDRLYIDIQTLADEDIIDDRIRKAFDTIRVSGNDYTHAGRIYPDDNRQKAHRLFELTNVIVRTTIQDDRLIDEMYSDIPEPKKRENND